MTATTARLQRRIRRDFREPGAATGELRLLADLPQQAGYDGDVLASERVQAAARRSRSAGTIAAGTPTVRRPARDLSGPSVILLPGARRSAKQRVPGPGPRPDQCRIVSARSPRRTAGWRRCRAGPGHGICGHSRSRPTHSRPSSTALVRHRPASDRPRELPALHPSDKPEPISPGRKLADVADRAAPHTVGQVEHLGHGEHRPFGSVRNSVCALRDHKFYVFFTLTVHFGDALIVYLPRHP
jgi:hypothetical protein